MTVDLRSPEAFHLCTDRLLALAPTDSPWSSSTTFKADTDLLGRLLSVPLRQGKAQQAGLFAKAADAWVANELRRAGFGANEVWPRARRPRVLPQPLVELEAIVEPEDRPALRRLVRGTADARLLGAYYDKQVDVVIADWDRGAELMVSTRSMLSSYKNNLHNRSEDLVGDADNLRGRYPLASLGLLFVVRSNILEEPGALPFVSDMLGRMRDRGLYDAAGLIIANWDEDDVGVWEGELPEDELVTLLDDGGIVNIVEYPTAEDLRPGRFFLDLITAVLDRTPVSYHVEVRQRRTGENLQLPEGGA